MSGAALAAEDSSLTVVPSIDYGFKQSSLNFSVNGGPYTSLYKPGYVTFIPSLAVGYGRFYGALSYDTPLTEFHTSSGGDPSAPAYSDYSYSREETTLTLGYRVLPSLNVFGGYTNGETKLRTIDYTYSAGSWSPAPDRKSVV